MTAGWFEAVQAEGDRPSKEEMDHLHDQDALESVALQGGTYSALATRRIVDGKHVWTIETDRLDAASETLVAGFTATGSFNEVLAALEAEFGPAPWKR